MKFKLQQYPSSLKTVNKFIERMRNTTEKAKSTVQKVQEDIVRYYNQQRTLAPVFKPRDKIFLDALDIWTTWPSQKLSYQRLGPFTIEQQVRPMAYKLKLPYLIRQLYPIFNVVKLSITLEDLILGHKPEEYLLFILINGKEKWKVEEILNSHWHWR